MENNQVDIKRLNILAEPPLSPPAYGGSGGYPASSLYTEYLLIRKSRFVKPSFLVYMSSSVPIFIVQRKLKTEQFNWS